MKGHCGPKVGPLEIPDPTLYRVVTVNPCTCVVFLWCSYVVRCLGIPTELSKPRLTLHASNSKNKKKRCSLLFFHLLLV